jgi:hypothetical protein
MSAANGAEYEHWPDNATQYSSTASTIIPGYDFYNGLREYSYTPADDEQMSKKEDKPKASEAPNSEHTVITKVSKRSSQQPPAPYICMPYPHLAAYPAPAYYGLPPQGMPGYACPPGYGPMCVPITNPAPPKSEEPKKQKKRKPEALKWQGRTKQEVEEDDMKIAAKEGAYEKRKVEPVGLAEDQPVWVVLEDGKHGLRYD